MSEREALAAACRRLRRHGYFPEARLVQPGRYELIVQTSGARYTARFPGSDRFAASAEVGEVDLDLLADLDRVVFTGAARPPRDHAVVDRARSGGACVDPVAGDPPDPSGHSVASGESPAPAQGRSRAPGPGTEDRS